MSKKACSEAWVELAEIYATGALDGEDLSRFQHHLTLCVSCRDYLCEVEQDLALLPQSLNLCFPSPDIKDNLLHQITEDIDLPWLRPATRRFALAMVGGAVVMGGLIAVLTVGITNARQKLLQFEGLAAQLTTPGTKMVEMKGMGLSPNATAKILVNGEKGKCILVSMNMAPLPEGKVYELWGMKGDKPFAAGTFTVDKHGCAVFHAPVTGDMKDFDKFAVTLEPVGGVTTPTGPMHLLGTVIG